MTYEQLQDAHIAALREIAEQRDEIERLQAQLAGWKELEGKDIYQYCVDLRGTIRDLKAQLAPNG